MLLCSDLRIQICITGTAAAVESQHAHEKVPTDVVLNTCGRVRTLLVDQQPSLLPASGGAASKPP